MSTEDTLRRTFDDHLGGLDLPSGDVAGARRAGARMRTRRRLTVSGVAAAVLALALAGVVDARRDTSLQPAAPLGRWREIPTPPLAPRADALAVWTGREAIVLGGGTEVCPPNADCASAVSHPLRDGAAYDPRTNTWRTISPAPVPVGPGDRLVAAAGVVVLRHWLPHGSSWFTYEPDHNSWLRIPHVPAGVGDLPSAYGPRVYATVGRRVAVYDVTRFRWSLLPPDPAGPPLAQRRVTATPDGPVVTGSAPRVPPAARGPDPVIADVYDGHRWQRYRSTGVLGNDWSWAGDRMVDFDSFAHQGMTPEDGLAVGGQLDPATGRWGRLPDSALETSVDGWSPVAVGPGRWAACWGLVYDVAGGLARTLPRPDGAPDDGVAATWAGDRLLAFGGASFDGNGSHVTAHAWVWSR